MEIKNLIDRLDDWDGVDAIYNGEFVEVNHYGVFRLLEEAAAALEQLQAENSRLKKEIQQIRWIPVEERLPDKPGHYLVCTNVNYWHGGCMDKNGSSSNAGTTDGYAGTTLSVLDCFYDITGDWNRVCNAHVTHWMPLPQPPKEASHD